MDPLSPVAPARLRVLLLPVGRIKRSRFLSFVERLRPYNVVRLGDVSPDARPNRNMFSPLAFPGGSVIYNLTLSLPPESQASLAPFELFRETLVIVGFADSQELKEGTSNGVVEGVDGGADVYDKLASEFGQLQGEYPRALVHQLFLFDQERSGSTKSLPDDMVLVPPLEQVKTTTMKTIMCDLTSLLLAEMTTFAKSLQGLPTIESPSAPDSRSMAHPFTASGLHTDTMNRNSAQPHADSPGVRFELPANAQDKARHRMSMPVQRSMSDQDRVMSTTGSRSGSPARPMTPPNTTFDDMNAHSRSPTKSPLANVLNRSSAGGASRESSRDRISVHGFGSGSLSERARNKGKGRVGLVIGSLYLLAGRWGDAFREFVESASIAKANSDHLWHAKALDNILVAMLMLAWAGMDFQIPLVCYPIADKSGPAFNRSSALPDPSSLASGTATRSVSLQHLTSLLPDLLNTILNFYTRAANFTGEALPQMALSETCIRFSKLSTAVHLSGGQLDDAALARVVIQAKIPNDIKLGLPRTTVSPSRNDITSMLFRASPLPGPTPELSVTDRILILAGIASVLSSLRLHRKRAFIIRELIITLIPGLIHARKVGAAEMGVHPAAGLAAMTAVNGASAGIGANDLGAADAETGMEELLGLLGRTYGVVSSTAMSRGFDNRSQTEGSTERSSHTSLYPDTDEAIISRITREGALRSFGHQSLKMNVLRYCINLCEALPDFHGVLRYTTELLRTAGSGIAPRPDSDEGSANLSRDEQVRLATNISRTVGAAKKLGIPNIEADYWDEFLVRGVELLESPVWKRPVPRIKAELEVAEPVKEMKEKSPFIYNPFRKKPAVVVAEKLLVAGEPAEFRIILQNPFDFEIEIKRIRLETKDDRLESFLQGTIIGPYRSKMLSVSATPIGEGNLTITGCIVKIRGCRERRFPIFADPWAPARPTKIKAIGLVASPLHREDWQSTIDPATSPLPRISSVNLIVIRQQPVIVVQSTSLTQSATMLLEGETKVFTITLRNISETTRVDLLLFSFQDSTAGPLQSAMSNKETPPTELYELELLFAQKGAFRWRRDAEDVDPVIEAGQTLTLEVEVLGKPGLTSGVVQLDYAHLGCPRGEVANTFYTRTVSVPVTITVNASIELARVDVMPFDVSSLGTHPTPLANGTLDHPTDKSPPSPTRHHIHDLFELLHATSQTQDYFLLLLDLRNTWTNPLDITILLQPSSADVTKPIYTLTQTIPAGHTTRLVLPLPRIFLTSPHRPIPTLNPANQRQFVLGASKLSPSDELASREAFWYREEILSMLQGTWHDASQGRSGAVDLRVMRLTPRMVAAVRIEDVGIEMAVSARSSQTVHRVTPSLYTVPTRTFLTLTTTIHNRTSQPVYPLLRLQPTLRYQPQDVAVNIGKKFLWHGVLQRGLPLLDAGEKVSVEMGVCVLCCGEFEIGASVEEGRIWVGDETSMKESKGEQRRIPTRRRWGLREACVLVARDMNAVADEEVTSADDDGEADEDEDDEE